MIEPSTTTWWIIIALAVILYILIVISLYRWAYRRKGILGVILLFFGRSSRNIDYPTSSSGRRK